MKASIILAATGLLIASCSGGQSGTVSECGGFEGLGNTYALTNQDATDYCDAEVILWTYDSAAKSLTLSNERIELNCCGDHSINVEQIDEATFTVTEEDAPEFGDARCGCMCVFDFTVTADEVVEGVISLEVTREVTDDENPYTEVYTGDIDLSAGEGRIVVDDNPTMWCGDEMT